MRLLVGITVQPAAASLGSILRFLVTASRSMPPSIRRHSILLAATLRVANDTPSRVEPHFSGDHRQILGEM